MSIERVSEYAIADIATAYRDAGLSAADLDFYSTAEWFRNLASTCLFPDETAIALRAEGVVLPLRLRAPARLPPVGREARGLSNFYSCRFAPVGLAKAGADAPEALAAIARAVADRGVGRVRFDALAAAEMRALAAAFRTAGWLAEPFCQFGTWFRPTPGLSFVDYWAARPGKLRSTGARRTRALVEREGAQIQRFHGAADAEAAIQAYETVYATSWQPAEPFPAYMPGLIRYGLAAGTLEVWALSLGERPLAAQVWVHAHGQATIFKLAYDEAWRKQSPGTVLTMHAMEHALASARFHRIDLGWGDDSYKQDWLDQREQRFGLAVYNPRTARGMWTGLRNLLPKTIKSKIHGHDRHSC